MTQHILWCLALVCICKGTKLFNSALLAELRGITQFDNLACCSRQERPGSWGNLSLFATSAETSASLWAFGWRLNGSPAPSAPSLSSGLHSSLDPRQVVLTRLSLLPALPRMLSALFPRCHRLPFAEILVLRHDVAQMAYLTQAGTEASPPGRAGVSVSAVNPRKASRLPAGFLFAVPVCPAQRREEAASLFIASPLPYRLQTSTSLNIPGLPGLCLARAQGPPSRLGLES